MCKAKRPRNDLDTRKKIESYSGLRNMHTTKNTANKYSKNQCITYVRYYDQETT